MNQFSLQDLTVDDYSDLPRVELEHDSRKEHLEGIAEQRPSVSLVNNIRQRTGFSWDVSKELAKLVLLMYKGRDYGQLLRALKMEATRYLQTKALRGKRYSAQNIVLDSYISNDKGWDEKPKKFLFRKIRNAMIFFPVFTLLLVVASRFTVATKSSTGLDRNGTMLLVLIIGSMGVWNYMRLPAQYKARKQLKHHLEKIGFPYEK